MLVSRRFLVLAISLGWQDVKNTYLRSTLGPWWITLGLAVQVAAIGLIFGVLFDADLASFFPFLSISLVLWNSLVSTITDSTNAYVQSQQIIKQIWVPSFFSIVRVLAKNVITLLHNATIVVVILLIFRIAPGVELLLAIPGALVVFAVLYGVSAVAGIISARYRDVPPMISSALTVGFYLTPVIWMPDSLPEEFRDPILAFNPLYSLMELVRAPLLGSAPTLSNWLVSLGSLSVVALGALWVTRKYSWKVVYWL